MQVGLVLVLVVVVLRRRSPRRLARRLRLRRRRRQRRRQGLPRLCPGRAYRTIDFILSYFEPCRGPYVRGEMKIIPLKIEAEQKGKEEEDV
jgi:hypothetical protein